MFRYLQSTCNQASIRPGRAASNSLGYFDVLNSCTSVDDQRIGCRSGTILSFLLLLLLLLLTASWCVVAARPVYVALALRGTTVGALFGPVLDRGVVQRPTL